MVRVFVHLIVLFFFFIIGPCGFSYISVAVMYICCTQPHFFSNASMVNMCLYICVCFCSDPSSSLFIFFSLAGWLAVWQTPMGLFFFWGGVIRVLYEYERFTLCVEAWLGRPCLQGHGHGAVEKNNSVMWNRVEYAYFHTVSTQKAGWSVSEYWVGI